MGILPDTCGCNNSIHICGYITSHLWSNSIHTMKLLPLVSPEGSVSVSPLNMVFERGNDATFNCTAEGGPGNTYQWQQNGTNLDNETMQTLAITQISVNDGDQYTCIVSNAAGNDSASTSLFVYPEITIDPVHIMDAINGTVRMLACDADAFPEPQYQWVRVGGDFGDNINGINSDMLVFAPVLFGDEGEYFCTATANGHTVQSNSSTLTGTSQSFQLD